MLDENEIEHDIIEENNFLGGNFLFCIPKESKSLLWNACICVLNRRSSSIKTLKYFADLEISLTPHRK